MTADTDRVLVFNCGSSSLKYRLLEPRTGRVLATGMVERIGEAGGHTVHSSERHQHTVDRSFADHAEALDAVLAAFAEHGPDTEQGLVAVGHRVVHGGRRFSRPIRVDDEVLAAIDRVDSSKRSA